MDLVLTVILLVVLSPMLLLIALLIKLTSRGPVLYSPTSIGRHGKPFTFYKFRSMHANVSHDTHKKLVADFIRGKVVGAKLRKDPRVTKIGRFLRKYSLDEFPQLFNVLKGDMSLVGPRPSTQYEYDMMEAWHRRRFEVLPGITGLWQVSGRAEVSHNDMVMMDLYYIENCSLWSDIVILFKTVAVVLKGKGGH
jgi:undecaprenyl-phosphate galactose phosphotransferase